VTSPIHSGMYPPKQRLWSGAIIVVLCNFGFAQTPNPDQVASSRQRLTVLESLQSTLANDPQVQIQQQQVEVSRALKQQASGQFDLALDGNFSQSHTNSPLTRSERALLLAEGFTPSSDLAQNLSVFNVGVTKQYRTGVAISPLYQTTRTTDNLSTSEGTNVSRLAFRMLIPLLRGRGRAVVGAQETAADVEVRAALLDLNQTLSNLLATTATSYWNAVAAARQVEVARTSEQRGRTYVDNAQTLIQADRLAKSEINQAAANLTARTANRIAAEQNLIQAEQQLALAMGLDVAQIQRAAFSFEDFPQPLTEQLPASDADVIQKYVQSALTRRADYLAAQTRVEESRVLLVPARNGLKPRLDLNFSAGYTGLSEGTAPAQFLNSGYRSVQGLDASGAVTYNFPFRNDLAIGQLRQAQASLTQAQLRAADIGRQVSSAVVSAYNAVKNAAAQLENTHQSVKFAQAALDGERQKFSLGFNSLVDVLTVEDRLTTAMISEVNDEFGYALALTQLRLATGTIVDPYQEVHSVDRDIFFTLP
jgi:outer membrane protein